MKGRRRMKKEKDEREDGEEDGWEDGGEVEWRGDDI